MPRSRKLESVSAGGPIDGLAAEVNDAGVIVDLVDGRASVGDEYEGVQRASAWVCRFRRLTPECADFGLAFSQTSGPSLKMTRTEQQHVHTLSAELCTRSTRAGVGEIASDLSLLASQAGLILPTRRFNFHAT